jgi:GTPase SAR1 family protein
MASLSSPSVYNVHLLGDSGVGKSTLIHKMNTNTFRQQYMPNSECCLHPFNIPTNYGDIVLNLYDCVGLDKYNKHTPTTEKFDAAIIMFDLTNKVSYHSLDLWYNKCKSEPVFVIGNKSDCASRRVKSPTFHEAHSLPYLPLSSKLMTSYNELFTPILQHFTAHDDLVIIN